MRQVESRYAPVYLEVVWVLDLATFCSKEARATVINGLGVGVGYQVSQPLAGLMIQPELKGFVAGPSNALVVETRRDVRERPAAGHYGCVPGSRYCCNVLVAAPVEPAVMRTDVTHGQNSILR